MIMSKKINLSKKTKIVLLCILCVSLIFLVWSIVQNQFVHTREITIVSENLPESFSGCKIAHVSDLHNAEFGEGNEELLSLLEMSSPDIIIISGDIIDSRRTDVNIARNFINKASEIAPVYYTTGNHESRVSKEDLIDSVPLNSNVNVLHNRSVFWQKGEDKIQIIGIDDPSYMNTLYGEVFTDEELKKHNDNDYFKILSSHRPENFNIYVENNIDVVFSGHAHGGQIRLPFIGGTYAPHQGLFPEFDSGLYTENDTNMVVSRGLGNSIFPFRINNPPEIIIVTLKK